MALALPQEKFDDLVRIGSFGGETDWLKVFALAASTLNDVSLVIRFQKLVCKTRELHSVLCS